MVPTPVATVNLLPHWAGSLVPDPSHRHSVNEDLITSEEPFEPAPGMDKGKYPMEEVFSVKRIKL